MAVKKVKHGWVAPFDPGLDFDVEEGKPTGILVHDQRGYGVMLNYAGVGGAGEFLLPRDKKALRAIARAIVQFAGDEEHVKQ